MNQTTIADTVPPSFERTTTKWGRITLILGLVVSLYFPIHLVLFSGADVTAAQLTTGFLAVAATFGIFWLVEPLTYYPILGPAGMYQAFLIGNISNKLLPAAITAQSSIKSKAGTKKAQFAATAAICGAALVHVTSLLLFVGILGSWVVSVVPENITEIAQAYILPSVLGGVLVQLIANAKDVRTTIAAIGAACVIVFGVMPLLPEVLQGFSIAFTVLLTVAVAWFAKKKVR